MWHVDPEDTEAVLIFGNVQIEFDEYGNLKYQITDQRARQIINLNYYIVGDKIITTQPSSPKTEYTKFSYTEKGSLLLEFGGMYANFIRKYS